MAEITSMIAELKDMIGNTILPNNGGKQITGQAVYDIMMSLVELVEESAAGGNYVFPENMAESLANDGSYTFTTEEATAFKKAWENYPTTTFVVTYAPEGWVEKGFAVVEGINYDSDSQQYTLYVMAQFFVDNFFYEAYISENNGQLIVTI